MNPYEILGVAPGSDNGTVVKAVARALKERRHDAGTLAAAQRALLDPSQRTFADFTLPVLPVPKRLRVPPEPPEPEPLPAWPPEDFAVLASQLEAELEADRLEAAAIAASQPPASPLSHDDRR
jgi:hypothetical protein